MDRKMVNRIQQEDAYGCAVACIAMATVKTYQSVLSVVKQYWSVFKPFDKYSGLDNFDEQIILFRLGFRAIKIPMLSGCEAMKRYVGEKQAILTVPSLNVRGLYHAIFWDGENILDPSPFRQYTTKTGWEEAIEARVIRKIYKDEGHHLYGIGGAE